MGDAGTLRDRPCVTIRLRFLAPVAGSLLPSSRFLSPFEAPSIPLGRALGPLDGNRSRALIGAVAAPRAENGDYSAVFALDPAPVHLNPSTNWTWIQGDETNVTGTARREGFDTIAPTADEGGSGHRLALHISVHARRRGALCQIFAVTTPGTGDVGGTGPR